MRLCLALLCGSLGWAQLQTNSIEITTTRTLTATPDQVTFNIWVDTGFGYSLSDVLNAISSVGITADNFAGLSSPFLYIVGSAHYSLEWDFSLTVPLSKASSTMAQLASLAVKTARIDALLISFGLQGVSTSPTNQPTCAISDLVADATAQAQALADAANVRLGPVLAISNQRGTSTGIISFFILSTRLIPPLSVSQTCTATFKFGIVRL